MAKDRKKSKSSAKAGLKWKKKRWFQIVAPPLFQAKPVGESFAENVEDLSGRTVVTNMMAMQGNIKKQNLSLTLKVSDFKDDKAHTSFKDFHLQRTSVKKLIRKRMSKVEDSFVCMTKDGQKVRAKVVLGTRSHAKGGAKAALSKMSVQWSVNKIAETNFNDMIRDLVEMKFQKELKSVLDKIYPLKVCQVRFFGTVDNPRVKHLEVAPLPEVKVRESGDEEKPAKKKATRKRKSKKDESESENKKVEETEENKETEEKVEQKEEKKADDNVETSEKKEE